MTVEYSDEESRKLMYLIMLGLTYEYSESFTLRYRANTNSNENIYYWEYPENWKGNKPIISTTNEIFRLLNDERTL